MKVMKFGGGCLRDAEGLERAAVIIQAESRPPVVVVSAVKGVTDRLLEAAADAARNERRIPAAARSICETHLDLASRTIAEPAARKAFGRACAAAGRKIERLLYGIAFTGEAQPAVRSRILSFGERLAAHLLAGVLAGRGLPARALESDRIGMRTDDDLENATIRMDAFRRAFAPTARKIRSRAYLPVVTGFFGVTDSRRVSLFGRNGSDYSASVLAAVLEAKDLEIWKDVDGFMTADPKIVPGARPVRRLSFYEAAELSYFGARILHPRTLEPLLGTRVAVRIKSLFDPDGAGTEIVRRGRAGGRVVKGITSDRTIALLRIHGPGVGYKPGIIARLGRDLAARGINIHSILTSQTCINLIVGSADARRSLDALRPLEGGVIRRVDGREDAALIGIVGQGFLKTAGLAARIFAAVAWAGINVEMIAAGASEVAAYFIVRARDAGRAVAALHREFFGR